jgi:hypothetical protein
MFHPTYQYVREGFEPLNDIAEAQARWTAEFNHSEGRASGLRFRHMHILGGKLLPVWLCAEGAREMMNCNFRMKVVSVESYSPLRDVGDEEELHVPSFLGIHVDPPKRYEGDFGKALMEVLTANPAQELMAKAIAAVQSSEREKQRERENRQKERLLPFVDWEG